MIRISNAYNINNKGIDLDIASEQDIEVDASGLTVLPGLIDPHVHFRTPGLEYKEDWLTAAKASICGGYTTVFDMPNTLPPTITAQRLLEKKQIIDEQLKQAGIPLHYQLYFGADKNHLNEIPAVKDAVIGIKVFMGCSTGNLVIDDDESLHAVFQIAAAQNMLVAVHAEDEHLLQERKKNYSGQQPYHIHSVIRDTEVAAHAVEKAISLAERYGTRLYILHVSSQAELALIKAAKQKNLPVYAETTPHHLFLNENAYAQGGGKVVMNPPLRTEKDNAALLDAIRTGVIDTIGSDHAPHTLSEKQQPYGTCPCGVPGIETTLPLLLNACHEEKLSLAEIVKITSQNAQTIFQLPKNNDMVLVDRNKLASVDEKQLKTKCGWSPFAGKELRGWPVYTILRGQVYFLEDV